MSAGRDEDKEIFAKAMSGVNPLRDKFQDTAAATRKASSATRLTRDQDRTPVPNLSGPVSTADMKPVHGPVLFVRPGLQKNVVRKLKRGGFRCDDTLDLHGLTKTEAGKTLNLFIHRSVQYGYRCLLVIHGKGRGSAGGQGILKPYTVNWLKQCSAVLAFTSTQPKDGGTGSVYVLLKSGSGNQRP